MSVRTISSEPFLPILRESIPGEYLAMLGMLAATLGGVYWGVSAFRVPSGVGLAVASIWIFARCTGSLAGRWPTLLTSTAIALLVLFIRGLGEIGDERRLQSGPFAPNTYLLVLSAIAVIDVVDVWRRTMAEPEGDGAVSRHRRAVQLLLRTLGLIFVVYMIAVPAVNAVIEHHRVQRVSRLVEDMSLIDHVRLRTTEAFFVCMFFVLGATVGSFLNVVAYRLPRGESLVRKRSRCPACQTSIAGRDNIPILGWLLLGGRCRACNAPISPRYPIIEFAAALLFLGFYFVELISGGANIPLREPNSYHGVVWILFYTKWDLVGLYTYHCLLFSTLLAWMLMDLDGNRIPRRSVLSALLIAFIPPLYWQELQPVPVCLPIPAWIKAIPLGTLLAGPVIGGTIGAFLGWLVSRSIRLGGIPNGGFARNEATPALCLVGIVLGWQAALGVTLIALAVELSMSIGWQRRTRWPVVGSILIAATFHHLLWRVLVGKFAPWWPGPEIRPTFFAGFGAVLVILLLAEAYASFLRADVSNAAVISADRNLQLETVSVRLPWKDAES